MRFQYHISLMNKRFLSTHHILISNKNNSLILSSQLSRFTLNYAWWLTIISTGSITTLSKSKHLTLPFKLSLHHSSFYLDNIRKKGSKLMFKIVKTLVVSQFVSWMSFCCYLYCNMSYMRIHGYLMVTNVEMRN